MQGEDLQSNFPPRKNQRWRPSIFSIILVSLCCVSFAGFSIYSANLVKPDQAIEKASIQNLVDQFLQFLSARDIQKAYDLFSTEAKKNTPKNKLENIVAENYSVLFRLSEE
jgi:hypothetical protein